MTPISGARPLDSVLRLRQCFLRRAKSSSWRSGPASANLSAARRSSASSCSVSRRSVRSPRLSRRRRRVSCIAADDGRMRPAVARPQRVRTARETRPKLILNRCAQRRLLRTCPLLVLLGPSRRTGRDSPAWSTYGPVTPGTGSFCLGHPGQGPTSGHPPLLLIRFARASASRFIFRACEVGVAAPTFSMSSPQCFSLGSSRSDSAPIDSFRFI